jgi:hypothetical protein
MADATIVRNALNSRQQASIAARQWDDVLDLLHSPGLHEDELDFL